MFSHFYPLRLLSTFYFITNAFHSSLLQLTWKYLESSQGLNKILHDSFRINCKLTLKFLLAWKHQQKCRQVCTESWQLFANKNNTHTHTHLTALCPGTARWAGTRKVKPIWILLKQKTVSGSGISWAVLKSAPRSRLIAMPAPHHSVFHRPDALPATQLTATKHCLLTINT